MRPWPRFALLLSLVAAVLMLLLTALAYLLDPYDTGRPGLVASKGLRPQGPRTANASRGRDPAFSAAILGNSHVQMLGPERLDAATQARFVSLIVPGSGPREQLVLLDWFMRHRTSPPAALVFGLDSFWCSGDQVPANDRPFPFWLYERSTLAYLAGLVRYDTIEELPKRLNHLLHKEPERARPDGYWDYGAAFRETRPGAVSERGVFLGRYLPDMPVNTSGQFPAARHLAQALAALPAQTRVILIHPPVYVTAIPAPGTAEEGAAKACKAAFAAVAQARPGTAVIDWLTNIPEARDPSLWFDHTHYRLPLAEKIEASIAATLRSLE